MIENGTKRIYTATKPLVLNKDMIGLQRPLPLTVPNSTKVYWLHETRYGGAFLKGSSGL